MNVATYAFLVSQGYTTEQIESMENSLGAETPENNEQTETPENNEQTETPEQGDAPATNPDVAELTKTVKELADTVKAMQETNAKSAKGGKATKKTSESVIKDFFGQP